MTPLAWLVALTAAATIAGSIMLIRAWQKNPAGPTAPLLMPAPPPGKPPLLYRPDPVFAYVPNAQPASSHRPGPGRAHFTGTQCPASHAALADRQGTPGSAHRNAPRSFRAARAS